MTYVASDVAEPPRPPPKRRRLLGTPGVPWYRDRVILRLLTQVVFLVVVLGIFIVSIVSLVNNLEESNLGINIDVYKRPFGPAVSEGPPTDQPYSWLTDPQLTGSDNWYWGFGGNSTWYVLVAVWLFVTAQVSYGYRQQLPMAVGILIASVALLVALPAIFSWLTKEIINPQLGEYLAPRANARTLVTGLVNTLRVVTVSVIASTLLGILAGVGLLSRNFLVRNISMVYVEIFRNTPLLLQLLFVYTALITVLPEARKSIVSPDSLGPFNFHEKFYIFNATGITFPTLINTATVWWFFAISVIGCVIAWYVRKWRLWQQDQTGIPAKTWSYVLPIVIGCLVGGWLIAGGYPLSSGPFIVEYPAQTRFSIEGGYTFSIAFVALVLGLTLYTAAFIADIVRAGIQAVPYGQVEAARAHGLSNFLVLNLVVLPQALRLIIPPLGNQYVNVGKNSSLAVAVAYIDLYRVADLANNESGQAVPLFLGLMIAYLALSLTLSFLTNLLNSATKLRTR